MQPEILLDKSKLNEIFNLRVRAWENSNRSAFVNYSRYPNGWFDDCDSDAEQIVIFNQGKIIASIRLNYYNTFEQHPFYKAIRHIEETFNYSNFGYLSRLVVDQNYRFKGLSNLLFAFAEARIIQINKIFAALDATGFQVQNLKKMGYKEIGGLNTDKISWNIEPDNQILLIKTLL